MKNLIKLFALTSVCACAFLLGGCMDITGRGAAPLAKTVGAATNAYPRVGHVYCMRGWLGIFSTGMDRLAEEIDSQVGVPAVSVADEEWRRLKGWLIIERGKGEIQEPLVLLGHSWGADDMIRVAQELKDQNISVDLLVLIDPVTPPPVPTNVKRVYCVYKSHPVSDAAPFCAACPPAWSIPMSPPSKTSISGKPMSVSIPPPSATSISKKAPMCTKWSWIRFASSVPRASPGRSAAGPRPSARPAALGPPARRP